MQEQASADAYRGPGSSTTGVSLAEFAYRAILDKLLTLEISPGDPLNDEELARSLGIGRTPVRDAIKRLETDRLVVTYHRRGVFATRVEVTDLALISEMRAQLEPLAASRAARVATAAMREELRSVLQEVVDFDASQASAVEMLRFDGAVHRAIYRAAANPYLEDALIKYDNLSTRIWCLVMERLPGVGEYLHEHIDLLEAIIGGQAELAAKLAREHVDRFESAVRAVLFVA